MYFPGPYFDVCINARLTSKNRQVCLIPFRPDDLAFVQLPEYALITARVYQWLAGPRCAVPVRVRSILGSFIDRYTCNIDPFAKVAEAVYEAIIVAFDGRKVTIARVCSRVPCMCGYVSIVH